MEFPNIGKHCSYKSCNRLDFLPFECEACLDVFCSEHFAYLNHECPAPNTRDVQVPVCPLCEAPVPGPRDEAPDVTIGAHIDSQCKSDRAKQRRKKIFTNRCSFKGCKTKEMMPVVCSECYLNYCLKHRHVLDHVCAGKPLITKRIEVFFGAALAKIKEVLLVIFGLILQFFVIMTDHLLRRRHGIPDEISDEISDGILDVTEILPNVRNRPIRSSAPIRPCRIDSLYE